MGVISPLAGCALLLMTSVIEAAIPKMLTVVFNTKFVKPGSSAEEKCQAKGNPKPKYIWKKDGNVLSTNEHYDINPNTGVIKIKSITLASGEGEYQCLAQNKHGTASSGFWEVRVASMTGADKRINNNPMGNKYKGKKMACEYEATNMLKSRTGDNTACPKPSDDKRRFVLNAHDETTVDPLSEVMQDLWNSDTSRLRDSDYNINFTGSRLFTYLNETTLNTPTYQGFLRLLDNYNRVVGQAEDLTITEVAEVDVFMNALLSTSVMSKTYTFLTSNGYIPDSSSNFRETMMELWFNIYSRSRRGLLDSSGFEHVMVGELKGTNSVLGFHNWIQFYVEEKNGNLHYQKFITRKEPAVIAIEFAWHGHRKSKTTFFLGTSPEFDLAIYTICSFVHPNNQCKFKINKHKVLLQTWDVTHKPGYQVATAYPLL